MMQRMKITNTREIRKSREEKEATQEDTARLPRPPAVEDEGDEVLVENEGLPAIPARITPTVLTQSPECTRAPRALMSR